jgi:hypothetical protein
MLVFTIAAPGSAQELATGIRQERPYIPRLVLGGISGGAVGILAGGTAGLLIGGNSCLDEGNPDSCRGLEGLAIGAYSGHALGAPLGVHLANGRKGSILPALLINAGTTALAGVFIHLADRRANAGEGVHPALLLTVAAGVPVTQLVSSVLIERATTRIR